MITRGGRDEIAVLGHVLRKWLHNLDSRLVPYASRLSCHSSKPEVVDGLNSLEKMTRLHKK